MKTVACSLLLSASLLLAQNSAVFLKTDDITQGKWSGLYGSSSALLAGAAVTPSGALVWTWAYSTSDPRALSANATTWYNSAFSVDLPAAGTLSRQVAVYAIDWDSTARSERVDVLDGSTGAVLNSAWGNPWAIGIEYLESSSTRRPHPA